MFKNEYIQFILRFDNKTECKRILNFLYGKGYRWYGAVDFTPPVSKGYIYCGNNKYLSYDELGDFNGKDAHLVISKSQLIYESEEFE